MKKYRIKKVDHVKEVVDAMVNEFSFKTDPQGSYTGRNENPFEVPVQDQDDL